MSTAFPCNFCKISAEFLFWLCRLLFSIPPSPQTLEKQANLVFLGLFPNFPFFPFLFFRFFRFFGGFQFPHFPFFGRARFRGIGPPAQGSLFLPLLPSQTHCHPSRQPNAPENASVQVSFCGGLPPSLPSMLPQMCCTSARRSRDAMAKRLRA